MHWQYTTSTPPQDIGQLKEMLLRHRGLATQADQEAFFHPTSPLEIALSEVGLEEKKIDKAVQRILLAKEQGEEVVIFGDYDADGVCSTAILWEALRAVGIIAKPFLPHREKHGYGLTMRSLTAVLEEHTPQLLITVDNGIVAHQAFAELKKRGINTILTDHHVCESELPCADVIVHTTQVCGSGVAWFLARALSKESAKQSLDLAAIATVADQMPLLKTNRSFVVHGIKALKKTKRVGLQVLMARAAIDPQKISTDTINFVIAPRINAMGRLKHSLNALRLVCTTSMERADELVDELNHTNEARQELTTEMIEHALLQASRWEKEHIIVVASTEYHEGVIGLLAGRLMEEYSKPAIAIAVGEKVAKASARSVAGVNIIELIRQIRDDLLEAGGHPMAAGFAAEPSKLESITARLEALARQQITEDLLAARLTVESELPLHLLTLSTAEELQLFAPFGQGNPEPVFAVPPGVVLMATEIGREGKHLRLEVGFELDGKRLTLNCIAWGLGSLAKELMVGSQIELAGCLSINEWKSRRTLQLMVKDLKQTS